MTDRISPVEWAALGLFLLLQLPLAVVTYNHLGEDAFITFCYVENFAAGHGLVYNIGERVEGYSNPLWLLLLTPFAMAGVKLHLAARLLSVFFHMGLIFGGWWSARRISGTDRPWWMRWWLPAALAAEPILRYHLDRGLETVPYASLIGLALFVLAVRGNVWLAGLFGALVALMRPEGIGFAAVLAPLAFLSPPREVPFMRDRFVHAAKYLALPVTAFVLLTLFRKWYFGDWLPNTMIAKRYHPPGAWREFAELTASHGFVPLIGLAGGFAGLGLRKTRLLATGTLLLWFAALGFQLQAGGLLAAGYRYLVTILVPSVTGVWMLVFTMAERDVRKTVLYPAAGALWLLVPILPMSERAEQGEGFFRGNKDARRSRFHHRLFEASTWDLAERWRWYLHDPIFLNAEAGRWIARSLPPDAVLAADQMGQLGFYAEKSQTIVDLIGLMDEQIAREGLTMGYLRERSPGWIVVQSASGEKFWPRSQRLEPVVPSLREFFAQPEFQVNYQPRWVLKMPGDYMKLVFVVYTRTTLEKPVGPIEEEIIGVPKDEFEEWWRVF